MADQPRGIRNNNPGNLRKSDDPWQGLAVQQTDKDFFVFKDATYGIRALARVLINYQDKYGLRNVRNIIIRWAPAVENNTAAYIDAVAEDTGFAVEQPLNLHEFDHLAPLVKAIIKHENGQQPYTEAQITKGLVLAGVEPPKSNLQATRTVQAGQLAAIGTVGSAVLDGIKDNIEPAKSALTDIVPLVDAAKWPLLIVTLLGIIIMVWARIDDRRKGLR